MFRDLGAKRPLAPILAVVVCAAAAGGLAVVGRPHAAEGIGLGLALFVLNTALLSATLRRLAVRDAPRGAAVLVAGSSLLRLLLLGGALSAIAVGLGKETFLGAAGGLAVAQISLLFKRSGSKGGA